MDLKARERYQTDTLGTIKMLTEFSVSQAQQTTLRWKKLGEYLMIKYIDGNVKKEQNGSFKRNAYGQPVSPDFPGYDARFYRSIANETGDKLKVSKTIHDKK